MYVDFKELPVEIQNALKSVGFRCANLTVKASETYDVFSAGGQGRRSFATVVNLKTGSFETLYGSWGGANMFNPRNHVDLDQTTRPLPEGFVVIRGSEGHGGVFASLLVNPKNVNKLLTQGEKTELTDLEKSALRVAGYRSGYRAQEAERAGLVYGPNEPTYKRLIELGYIKVNKAGAMSLTTAGKNARVD